MPGWYWYNPKIRITLSFIISCFLPATIFALFLGGILIHMYTWCYRRCRKKERKKQRKKERGNEKTRVSSGGIRTHDTLYSGQMLYQLSYQGSSAGRVRIKNLIRLYEQANLTLGIRWWPGYWTINDTNTKLKHIHDVIRDVERKKERKTPEAIEKWKWEVINYMDLVIALIFIIIR